jgi:hypothetical protein
MGLTALAVLRWLPARAADGEPGSHFPEDAHAPAQVAG